MHRHVVVTSFPAKGTQVLLDRPLRVKIAGPVSGGRNTLDGLCQAAAQEIAELVSSTPFSE